MIITLKYTEQYALVGTRCNWHCEILGINESSEPVRRNTTSVLKEEVMVTIPVDPTGKDGMFWNLVWGGGEDIA